jgi:hypothetical protein
MPKLRDANGRGRSAGRIVREEAWEGERSPLFPFSHEREFTNCPFSQPGLSSGHSIERGENDQKEEKPLFQ